jgi:hypothetical protein
MPGYTYIGKLKNSFICDKRLSAYDVRVYLSLKKWETWDKSVTVETMAKEIGVNRRKFGESIKVLEKLKYIKIERDTNWDCNRYRIHKKAHVTDCNNDEINCNTDVTESNLNDVTESNPLSIPNNIPNKEKDKKKVAAGKTLAVSDDTKLPDGINEAAWGEWLQHLKEKKKKPTPSAVQKQLKFLTNNLTDHVAIINQAILGNWQGLHPLKAHKPKTVETEDGMFGRKNGEARYRNNVEIYER